MAEIKNLEKVAKRIIRAAKRKERIIVYGDADLDGLASVVILKESVRNLGGEVAEVYFPERQKEGYGLNLSALRYLKKHVPALLICLDCGISNFKEADKAKQLGFELIIIDHHEVLDKLPAASIVVDPKQKTDSYPFKKLATAGIAMRLSRLIFGRKFSPRLRESFYELAALATVADMMPQEKENKLITKKGLRYLDKTFRPGLKVFFNKFGQEDQSIGEVSQKIIAALNFSEVDNHLIEAYSLLGATDIKIAERIADSILGKSYRRHQKIKEIVESISAKLPENPSEPIIFEVTSCWDMIILGSIASKICHKYHKPTFIIRKDGTESRGALRMPVGLNGVEAMKACSDILITYGGHPMAAGFTIKNKNLNKLKDRLSEHFEKL